MITKGDNMIWIATFLVLVVALFIVKGKYKDLRLVYLRNQKYSRQLKSRSYKEINR